MGPAPETQAVLTPLTEAAIFLVLTVDAGRRGRRCGELLADVSGLRRSVGFRIPEGELSCVVGLGCAAVGPARSASRARPGCTRSRGSPVREHTAVATPGDLLFHIRAHRLDLCFELAQRLTERLRGRARVVDEVHGFRSFDERDLLGFVDGTENPEGGAALAAVAIGDEDPGVRRRQLRRRPEVPARPRRPGMRWRSRSRSAPSAARSSATSSCPTRSSPRTRTSRSTRSSTTDGEQRQIMRFNMPFGRVGARRVRHLLHRLRAQPGGDRADADATCSSATRPATTTGSSTSPERVTGNLFFVPTADFLDDPSPTAPEPAIAAEPAARRTARSGSAASRRAPR